jgi:hypothetical protein
MFWNKDLKELANLILLTAGTILEDAKMDIQEKIREPFLTIEKKNFKFIIIIFFLNFIFIKKNFSNPKIYFYNLKFC